MTWSYRIPDGTSCSAYRSPSTYAWVTEPLRPGARDWRTELPARSVEAFEAIVPCGLEGVEMTSVERELGADVPSDLPARAREAVRASFLSRYG